MTLRTRLLIATAITSLAAVVLVAAATYVLLTRSQLRLIDDSLTQTHGPIEGLVENGSAEALGTISDIAPGTYVAVVDTSLEVTFAAPTGRDYSHGVDIDHVVLRDAVAEWNGRRRVTVVGINGDRARLRLDRFGDGDTLITGLSLHEPDEVRVALVQILAAMTVAAVGAASVFGALLIGRGLRPLKLVETSAREITDGELGERRVPGATEETEVGQLATSLNAMLDRLQNARDDREETLVELRASEARMRRFVADASHELRTPVTATAAYAELFERGARNHPDDLDRAMVGIRHETGRMAALIDDLMALARLDENSTLDETSVDLTETVFAAVDAARTISPHRTIQTDVREVIEVRGDGPALRRVIDNLLANVEAHTEPGTPCLVELFGEKDAAILRVSDLGAGVTNEQLDKIFDRFFRTDSSRTRASGGAGLGLAISAAAVEAHGGTIEASHNQPSGLTITVHLPTRP